MDRLAAIQVFAQVVESGSFAKAAERLGLSTSATSRHVAELESHLQTRLLNRTTRRVSLTESGRAFYERSVQLLADLSEAEQEAARTAVEPRGVIRLTTAVNFGARHVAPVIAKFLARHREVKFDVSLSDRVIDLSTLGVQNRIHAEILRLARAAGVARNRARLEPGPKHADIASQVSTYREQVTRELSALARAGILEKDGPALVVRDVARLEKMVEDVRGAA